jgi:hypothetical protein
MRFFGSLSPRPPQDDDERWATSHLTPGEAAVWDELANADRRHAVGVARDVVAQLGPETPRPVVAAALLHDCGKLDSGFGTFRRVGATVVVAVRGRDKIARGGGRLARYVRHPELGAARLTRAGSDPLTVAWVAEHHLPAVSWSVPLDVASALKAADGD